MQRPRLADQRADRREAVGEQPQRGVVGGRAVLAPRHPEGGDLGVRERLAREQLEERLLLRVRGREAALDQVDAEVVESVRDAHLLVGGQRHALPLHAVAEGGVVEKYLLCHRGERLSDVDFEKNGRAPAVSRRASGAGQRADASVIRSKRAFTPSMVQAPRRATSNSARRGRRGRRRRSPGSGG